MCPPPPAPMVCAAPCIVDECDDDISTILSSSVQECYAEEEREQIKQEQQEDQKRSRMKKCKEKAPSKNMASREADDDFLSREIAVVPVSSSTSVVADNSTFQQLIMSQSSDGSFPDSSSLQSLLIRFFPSFVRLSLVLQSKFSISSSVVCTIAALHILTTHYSSRSAEWKMIGIKARKFCSSNNCNEQQQQIIIQQIQQD